MSRPVPGIHVAITEAFPTQEDAAATLDDTSADWPYRGTWRMPRPHQFGVGVVHVFTDLTPAELVAGGWVAAESTEVS